MTRAGSEGCMRDGSWICGIATGIPTSWYIGTVALYSAGSRIPHPAHEIPSRSEPVPRRSTPAPLPPPNNPQRSTITTDWTTFTPPVDVTPAGFVSPDAPIQFGNQTLIAYQAYPDVALGGPRSGLFYSCVGWSRTGGMPQLGLNRVRASAGIQAGHGRAHVIGGYLACGIMRWIPIPNTYHTYSLLFLYILHLPHSPYSFYLFHSLHLLHLLHLRIPAGERAWGERRNGASRGHSCRRY